MAGLPNIENIVFLGGHVPRQCGIATFTSDIRRAIADEFPSASCKVLAVTDLGKSHDYPDCVGYEIFQEDLDTYLQAAQQMKLRGVEVLSLQHEYGIFGGESGAHVLALLEAVEIPVVATLHTILRDPNQGQRHVMHELNRLCDRFVVMAEHGKDILSDVYQVAAEKVDVIPHGVIDVPFLDPAFNKEQFDVLGKTVLLTFGLLSPNKGLENAIRALPEVIEKYPEVVYVIAGVTHPHLKLHEGEAYREMLVELVDQLGVGEYVKFENRFMDLQELTALIEASDIYLTPYLNEAQITSGALSYAFGAGKAIVSTPYWHAVELLADGRGQLVPFADPSAMAAAINRYLEDSCMMTSVRKRAYAMGRSMIWPYAARAYMKSFERARGQRSRSTVDRVLAGQEQVIPPINLQHLIQMTSHLGMFQHAVHNITNNSEGFCVDDNARAYILSVWLHGLEIDAEGKLEYEQLGRTYLAFMWDAFEPLGQKFRNFMSRSLEWLELEGSDDSHGRSLWAAGVGVNLSHDESHRQVCAMLFHRGLPKLLQMNSPRSWAFGLLGIDAYLQSFPGDREVIKARKLLVESLTNLYRSNSESGWRWFEPVLAYDNGRLSQAMIQSGLAMECDATLAVGLDSLRWLVEVQTSDGGWLSPVGSHGFWRKGGERACFDQQPLEAGAMVSACLQAERALGDGYWQRQAEFCLAWFTGHNDLGIALYDPDSGGCHDALSADHRNANQGAESSLAFQLALTELMLARQVREKGVNHAENNHT